MKEKKVRTLIETAAKKITAVALASALVIGCGVYSNDLQTTVPELVTFTDAEGVIAIEEDATPLAAPKVTTSTKTKKKTKSIKLKQKSERSYSENKVSSQTSTQTTTKKSKSKKATTTTQTVTKTVTQTSVVDKYTKGSKVDKQTTTIKTTVTKTVTTMSETVGAPAATAKPAAAATTTTSTNINVLAAKAHANVRNAYTALGFGVVIKPNVSYEGLFDARTRTITLKSGNDTVYHELGHFVAFAAGNVDTSAAFVNVFNSEKSKYTAYNKAYVLQNSSEYFAESYKEFVLNPAGLKGSRPQTYAFMQSAVAKITDAQVNKIATVYKAVWK